MIVYFNTSAVIPLIIEEPGSPTCERLWNQATRIASVRLLYAEARAALARAQRMGRLSRNGLASSVQLLDELIEAVDSVEVTEHLVRTAGALAEQRGLRGYDAIHLAAAQAIADHDTVFATGDKHLADAAADIGLSIAIAH